MNNDWIDLRPDAAHVARERERARKLRASGWWQGEIAKGRCHYCDGAFAPSELTLDHIVPVARGGRSVRGNVVPACRDCNHSKGHYTPAEQLLADLSRVARHELLQGGYLLNDGTTAVAVDPGSLDEVCDWLAANHCHLHCVVVTVATPPGSEVGSELRQTTGCLLFGPPGRSAEASYDNLLEVGDELPTPLGRLCLNAGGQLQQKP